jgi:hypothetical protein
MHAKLRNFLLICVVLLAPIRSFATYAYVGGALNASNANTVTYSPTAGNYLVVVSATSAGGGTPTVTVTDNGSGGGGYTNRINNVTTGSEHVSVITCGSASTGATTITITYNGGTPGNVQISVTEYSGLSSTGYQGISTINNQTTPGSGANAVVSNALTTTGSPAALIGISFELGANDSVTAGTSPIAFTRRTNGSLVMTEDARITSTGSDTATFTATHGATDNMASYVLAISEPGGASCSNNFWSATGSYAVPNGSSGSYWSTATGAFATPNCSSGTYWLKTGAEGAS